MSTKDFLQRYSTPFTTGLFAISLVSGVALFFHVGSTWFRGMHEVLSMALILPFVFHIWRNWHGFAAYFRRAPMWISLAVCLLATLPFLGVVGGEGGSDPRAVVFGAIGGADVAAVAALAKTDAATVVSRLTAAGVREVAATDTMSSIAERSGRDAFDIVAIALKP